VRVDASWTTPTASLGSSPARSNRHELLPVLLTGQGVGPGLTTPPGCWQLGLDVFLTLEKPARTRLGPVDSERFRGSTELHDEASVVAGQRFEVVVLVEATSFVAARIHDDQPASSTTGSVDDCG